MTRKYSWKPQLKDHRDFILQEGTILPSVDLRPLMPPVYDQQNLGSCTANAAAGAMEFAHKQAGSDYIPSRLFIYYIERVVDGDVKQDNGSTIRTSMKALNTAGAPHENLWPYIVTKFAKKPTSKAYADGKKNLSASYSAVNNIQAALSQNLPVVFGTSVYESFESQAAAETGIIPMPKSGERLLGGHAMLIVGYKDNNYIVRNSWGNWGDKGYCYIPFEYINKFASDFWTLKI